jgi:O-antigen/teichoic acid export membrane protein
MHLRQLVRGGLSNLTGWIATFAASFVCWAILARELGVASLGVYGFALWLSSTFTALATLGLPFTTEKNIGSALGRNDLKGALFFSKKLLKVQFLIAFGMTLVSIPVQRVVAPHGDQTIALLVAATVIPSSLQIALRSIFSGLHRFGLANSISVVAAVLQLIFVIGAKELQGGVYLMLGANLLASVVAVAISFRQFGRLGSKMSADSIASKQSGSSEVLWKFSLSFSYIALLEYILWDKSEVFFLQRLSTYEQIAFYTLAFAAAAKLIIVAQSFADTMLPIAARTFSHSSMTGLAAMFFDANRMMLLVLVPLSAAAAILAKPFLLLFCGKQFGPAVGPLEVLLAGIPIASLSSVGWAVIAAANHESYLAKGMTTGAVVSIVADFFLIRHYGALGAAIATTVAQIFVAVLFLWLAVKVTRSRFPWGTLWRSYVGSGLAFAPAFLARSNTFAFCSAACVGCALYPIVMWLLKEFKMQELRSAMSTLLVRDDPTPS